jgi:hypothetical protein
MAWHYGRTLEGRGDVWGMTLLLEPTVRAPGLARRFCGAAIGARLGPADGTAALIEESQLVASELVSNAIAAGCTEASITVSVRPTTVRLSVYDNASGLPCIARRDPRALGGRGLMLVDSLAARWGVETMPDGKRVWADLDITSEPADLLEVAIAGRPRATLVARASGDGVPGEAR